MHCGDVSDRHSTFGHNGAAEDRFQFHQFTVAGLDRELAPHHRDVVDHDRVRTERVDIAHVHQTGRPTAEESAAVANREADNGHTTRIEIDVLDHAESGAVRQTDDRRTLDQLGGHETSSQYCDCLAGQT